MPLADRFRRHADALERDRRSALSAALMRGAAADIDAGGLTAKLFENVSAPPGSVPQLRLLAALHHLVLAGRAPELASFYPSAGGNRDPAGAAPAVLSTIERYFDWIEQRLHLTVQTNEPGRSVVLYAALVWLSERFGLPIRLLEIGASAGLNLIPDRYCYVVGTQELGDPESAVRFEEPWQPGPPAAAGACVEIVARAGCDLHPLNPADSDDQLTLLSYIWPDELERIERLRAAIEIAAQAAPSVQAATASRWLPDALGEPEPGILTVVWQSVVRQYVPEAEWSAIEDALAGASADTPLAVLRMEPHEGLAGMRLTCCAEGEQVLATCGYHGPPVVWEAGRTGA